MIHVSRLQVAPVKSLAVVTCPRIQLDADGVAEDRRLFLLDDGGRVVTLREHPELGGVVPLLRLDARLLELCFPGGDRVIGNLDDVAEPVTATLFGGERRGHVLPGGLAEALGRFVGEPVRLVLADRTGTGWDEGPVSLMARASAEALEPPGEGDSRSRRFRMLVEVEGASAYEEDSWVGRKVRVGQAVLDVTMPLGRCLVINQSPETGENDWSGLKQLAALRGPTRLELGVVATVDVPGEVAVGDLVRPV